MNLEKQLGTILKQIIDQESLNYLKTNPFGVYQNLIDKDVAEHSARLILMTLLAKIPEKLERNNWDLETLIQYIQKECCLNQDAAETLANLYEKLFSPENRVNWKQRVNEGFIEFCGRSWHFKLKAESAWNNDGCCVDAEFSASFDLEVCDKEILVGQLKALLTSNPYVKAEAIYQHTEKILKAELSKDFDGYVTAEDYYPPVAEDYGYNYEEIINEFCGNYGFKVSDLEMDGETSDYY